MRCKRGHPRNKYGRKDHRGHWYCKKCQAAHSRKYAARQRGEVREYKMLTGCEVCGYNKNPRALDFHHVSGKKEHEIGHTPFLASDKLWREIGKCAVLCRNCHAEYHYP